MEKCHGKHRLAIDFFVFISYIWRNIKGKVMIEYIKNIT